MTAYASSTARTVFVGMPNQSVVAPCARSKSSDDSGPVGADPLEHAPGNVGVLCEDARRAPARRRAEPRKLARRDEGEPLVVRLEDLAPLVEQVAPGGVVLGHARVQDEVVGAAGDRERIELDRAEPAEDLEHGVRSTLERPRGSERVARDEKATCGLGSDLHAAPARRRTIVASIVAT